jgi:hypothetical protein
LRATSRDLEPAGPGRAGAGPRVGRYSRRRVGPRRSGRAAAPGPPASCTAARTRRRPLAAYERLQGALAAHDVLTDRGRRAPLGVAGPWCSWSRRSQRASMPARIRRADASHKKELPGSPLRHVAAGFACEALDGAQCSYGNSSYLCTGPDEEQENGRSTPGRVPFARRLAPCHYTSCTRTLRPGGWGEQSCWGSLVG